MWNEKVTDHFVINIHNMITSRLLEMFTQVAGISLAMWTTTAMLCMCLVTFILVSRGTLKQWIIPKDLR